MATTAQAIIDGAIQRSALNNPDLVPPAQLLRYITLFERQLYNLAGQVNPDYFGKEANTSTRATFGASWDLATTPGDVGVLSRAEVATIVGAVTGVAVGDKVNLIGVRWPSIDLSPRAYVRGRRIVVYGTELGAADANMVTVLKLFYSPVPSIVTSPTQSLTVPDEWTALVELPLARVLAIRDRRLDEIASIDEEYKMFLDQFSQAVVAFDHGVRRPLAAISAIQSAVSATGTR